VKFNQLDQNYILMKNIRPYQVCTRCVMDTSDPDITFDDQGHCNHCKGIEVV